MNHKRSSIPVDLSKNHRDRFKHQNHPLFVSFARELLDLLHDPCLAIA